MNADRPLKVPVVFYRTPAGTEVVRNWLRGLHEGDRNAIGQDLMRVQYRWPVGMPLPFAGGRPLGSAKRSFGQSDRAGVVQRPGGQNSGVSWIHQEDPEDPE